MHKRLWILSVILLLVSLPATRVTSYQVNESFTYQTGEVMSFDFYEGSYTIVDAMYTTCGPCKIAMTHLNDLYDVITDYDGNQSISMISISIRPDIDSLSKVGDFMDKFDANWDYGLDHNEEILNYFGFEVVPTTILLSPDGQILKTWIGITEANEILDEIDKHVDGLPGEFIRENNLDELLSNIFNSPFFYIFLIMLWTVIIYSGFRLIDRLSQKSEDIDEEVQVNEISTENNE